MKEKRYSFSVVDFLVGLAVVMILAALVIPHFVPPSRGAKVADPAHKTASAHARR
jgi:Tfp pilus assembly protein FimT